jgi:hypothetical protein
VNTFRGFLDHHWHLPFLWLLAIPFFTVPLTMTSITSLAYGVECERVASPRPWEPVGFLSPGYHACPLPLALATHAPGLLNLMPAVWLAARSGQARRVGGATALVGAAWLIVPALPIIEGAPLRCSMNFIPLAPICAFDGFWDTGFLIGVATWVGGLAVIALTWSLSHRSRAALLDAPRERRPEPVLEAAALTCMFIGMLAVSYGLFFLNPFPPQPALNFATLLVGGAIWTFGAWGYFAGKYLP